jgi:hypothetical protein
LATYKDTMIRNLKYLHRWDFQKMDRHAYPLKVMDIENVMRNLQESQMINFKYHNIVRLSLTFIAGPSRTIP